MHKVYKMSNDILNVPKAAIAFTAAEARLPTNSRLTRYLLYVLYGQTMRIREHCIITCVVYL